MFDNLLFQLPFIIFIGLFSQWLAWRFRMPAIVIMSIAGLIIGPFTGLVSPKETFGPIFHTIISLAVAVILFEGSLSLDFREIRGFKKSILRISTVGRPSLGLQALLPRILLQGYHGQSLLSLVDYLL